MEEPRSPQNLVAEIEAMQDDVLRRLDELNARIERTLAEFGAAFPKAAEEPTVRLPELVVRRAA